MKSGYVTVSNSSTILFDTWTSSTQESVLEQSELLPSRASGELETEFCVALAGDRPEEYEPPDRLAKFFAKKFIDCLASMDDPSDVYFDKKGNAVLEWHPGPRRAAVAVISGTGGVRFAATRYGETASGSSFLTGGVSQRLLSVIRSSR